MDVTELFKGIAIIIDDEINDKEAKISNILAQIGERNIPYLAYKSIPSDAIVLNFRNLAFVLLDWELISGELSQEDVLGGVRIPENLLESQFTENIEFLKKLLHVCFCPVFIFSNVNQDRIIEKLVDASIFLVDKPNHIFVKSKSDLTGKEKLFEEIGKWLEENPSIYVLKTWEKEYQQSARQLFTDFQKLSPMWPKIMWKTFGDDGANKSLELGELISRNLFTRMTPFEFSDEVLGENGKEIDKIDVEHVLEGERYLKSEKIHPDDISTGDIFKVESEEGPKGEKIKIIRYFLNIRAQCDLIRDSDVELYCLKGRITEKSKITFVEGQFIEKINHAVIPFLDNGMILEFLFQDLKILKWKDYKNKRIGRLLPPYITRVQQRYALYSQRQGLPRIPDII